jgi:amino acid transporter
VTLEPWRSIAITVVIVGFTTVNLIGVRETAVVSDVFAVAKLVPLLLFVVVGWFFVEPQRFALAEPPSGESFSRAVLLLVFAFGGFESSTINAGEVRDPRRDFPHALFTAMAVVVALYVSIQAVCIGTLPGLATSERPVADAAERFLGPPGAALIALGAVVSMAGTLNATTLAATRLPFAMAADGGLPRVLTATHRRFRTPHVAILVSSTAVLLVTLTQTFVSALTISTISRVIVYGVTCAGVLVLRRRADRPAGFTTPGGALVPVAAVVLCLWLVSNSPWREARDVAIAVAVGLAIQFAYVAARRGRTDAPAVESRPEPEVR